MNATHFDSFKELFEIIAKIDSEQECKEFLQDLCTIKELSDMTQRLQVAKLLEQGKNYKEISELTGASSATISRVNRCFLYSDGYKSMLKKLTDEKD